MITLMKYSEEILMPQYCSLNADGYVLIQLQTLNSGCRAYSNNLLSFYCLSSIISHLISSHRDIK